MRSTCHSEDDSDNWRVLPLQQFYLSEHGRVCPRSFWCLMAFAITFEDEDSMIVRSGAARLRHVPLKFDSPVNDRSLTFHFN